MGAIDLIQHVARAANRDGARSEADLQSDLRTLLLYGGLSLEDPEVRLETPAPGRRRIDIETGRTVIECKKDLRVGNVHEEALAQLAGYVAERTAELGQRYAGILTDGASWELYHLSPTTGSLALVSSFAVKAEAPDVPALLVWLEGVLSTAEKLAPTPTEVERKLGAASPGFQLDLAELRDIYALCREKPEVRLKRELWARLLAAAFGTHFADSDDLFIEHTYLVLTAEAVAHALVGFDLHGGIDPTELVTGELFHKHEITGVVDADFFDWPVATERGAAFVRDLARRLARFDWARVDHDVLKVLYESVIDPETRHALGEYYTPDWLAGHMVAEVVDEPLEQRVLDPACGSGTFLFWAVRRYLEAAEAAGLPNADAVAGATAHIFGIDLHPVAVTLARVTYLLAIGTERLQERGPLAIPVYLGDSIQIGQNTTVLSSTGITVYTTDGMELFAQELRFPGAVVSDAARFDQLIEELADRAANRQAKTKPPSIRAVLNRYGVTEDSEREEITQTFSILCHLHDNGRDHIWGYYIRNLARPLEFARPERRVDRLVGNPPWLRYNAMPEPEQREFRRLSQARGIWAPSQVVTSQDLAGLFVTRASELYLKNGGRLGFVMPAAALSRLQYSGFRTGSFGSQEADVGIAFSLPWELSGIRPQPFPVPAAVLFGTRTGAASAVALPEEALWATGAVPDDGRSWAEVEPLLDWTPGRVVVADSNFLSPYGALVRQGANLVPRVCLTVVEQPAGPLGVPAGKVRVESDRSSPEREPYSELDAFTGTIETQFVFDAILGENLVPFRVREPRRVVIPYEDGHFLPAGGYEIDAYPGLADWWRSVSDAYDRLKPDTTTHDLLGQIDYQSKLTNQFPLAGNRVAYTGRGARTCAARVPTGTVVDHALYWLPVESVEEAHFVCGVLNSDTLDALIKDALSKGLFGSRNIHRAPFRISFPEFDPENELHGAIADVAAEAEAWASNVELTQHTSTARRRVRETLAAEGITTRLEALVAELLANPEMVVED
jgi:SAM-dependent methyltransferase